ncbi:PAS domain-containing sensor histidine kinase [Capnocytophaga sp. ARDL2]|uniref:sensor histidine kinase n=1 Tax=Capnocytophaga sp. ARDL2 TaxID=3238809 RepID=UPI0035560268
MEKDEIGNLSLRNRIFIAMLSITITSMIVVIAVMFYQYRKEVRTYHQELLHNKEAAVIEHLSFILGNSPEPLTNDNLSEILKEKIFELSAIHDIQIDIYDLNGRMLLSSKGRFIIDEIDNVQISPIILNIIELSPDKRFIHLQQSSKESYRISYNYITDKNFKNLGILSLPYKQDITLYQNQIDTFLIRFGQITFFLLILSILMSYFLSNTITKSIQAVARKITGTRINKNEKLRSNNIPREIKPLIKSYNRMIDELEESANLLAKSEREHAWREMAKQVAHEIKNPLTPMRLTVQMFERKFDSNHPDVDKKMKDFCDTLIQQIDTMSSVASAFSNFASMPAQEKETIDLVKVIGLSLEIFKEEFIEFTHEVDELFIHFDKTQLIRIVTNLIKNALQAMPEEKVDPKIEVSLSKIMGFAILKVKDNGLGIANEHLERIFEPKFTTKTSGMGLGLAMIKNIVESSNGTITVSSVPNKETVFEIRLPV